MHNKEVIILVGIPGSGKSTWIKEYLNEEKPETYSICSADHWFEKSGTYKFNPKELKNAHEACLAKFSQSLIREIRVIFVDNTNIISDHRKPYIELAKFHGYSVKLKVFPVNVDLSSERNVHGVPKESIQNMANKLDIAPGFYELTNNEIKRIDEMVKNTAIDLLHSELFKNVTDPGALFEATPSKKKKTVKLETEVPVEYERGAAKIELTTVLQELVAKAQALGNPKEVFASLNTTAVPLVLISEPLASMEKIRVAASYLDLWGLDVSKVTNAYAKLASNNVLLVPSVDLARNSQQIPEVVETLLNQYEKFVARKKDLSVADDILSLLASKKNG